MTSESYNIPGEWTKPAGTVSSQPIHCPNGFIYIVQSGDTLSGLAESFHVSVEAILEANPQIWGRAHRLEVGETLCIPHTQQSYCIIPVSPTREAPASAHGWAVIHRATGRLTIAAFGLPEPETLGDRLFRFYVAEFQTDITEARFRLHETEPGTWQDAEDTNINLLKFDELVIMPSSGDVDGTPVLSGPVHCL